VATLTFQCDLVRRSGFKLAVEFSCGDGVTALCGPSGSGKTTILSLIAGLLRPAAGVIRLHEQVLVDTRAGVWLPPERRGVGCVFQDGCLFPHLTVRQNLEYGWRRQRPRPAGFEHLVEVLQIGDLLDRAPLTLSGGQQQRVALGRALLQRPRLLLLDEPLTGLDEPLQERVLAHLKRVLDEFAVPTLLVTHNAAHIDELARVRFHVKEGRIVPCGDPSPQ
jgi:molybdate transport system ATP-binding protein